MIFEDSPYYHPIGVWVQGPGPGLDFIIRYLPGKEKGRDTTESVKALLREQGQKNLPRGFLEYWQSSISPYRGDRLTIMRTTRFKTKEACAKSVLEEIKKVKKDTSQVGKPVKNVSIPNP